MTISIIWTIISSIIVLLALGSALYGSLEYADCRLDLQESRRLKAPLRQIALANKYKVNAHRMFWTHILILLHQGLFLHAGLYALFSPNLPPPRDLPTIASLIIPVDLIAAQIFLVVAQVLLFLIMRRKQLSRHVDHYDDLHL